MSNNNPPELEGTDDAAYSEQTASSAKNPPQHQGESETNEIIVADDDAVIIE